MTDVLIIGAGPAGLTAAIYAARAGRSVIVCERETMGGQITHAHRVNNYPGLTDISGIELGDRLCEHAISAGAQIEFTEVTGIAGNADGTFRVTTDDDVLTARSLIYAGGADPRKLGLDREDDLAGSGISYCALCDGSFFQDQDVAVVGGGNSAFGDALFLSSVCRSVTLIHRRAEFRAEAAFVQAAKRAGNIRFLTGMTVSALHGDDGLEAVTLTDRSGLHSELKVSALFVALGRIPECSLVSEFVKLDETGYILTTDNCETGTPGLYAAGDCRRKQIRQLTTAAADGTIAAVNACAYLTAMD